MLYFGIKETHTVNNITDFFLLVLSLQALFLFLLFNSFLLPLFILLDVLPGGDLIGALALPAVDAGSGSFYEPHSVGRLYRPKAFRLDLPLGIVRRALP